MIEHVQYDLTLSTGFKTPIHIERYFTVDEQTNSSLFRDHIAKHNPVIIGSATNFLFVLQSIPSAISYSGKRVTVLSDSDNDALIRVEAGKNWHELIMEMLRLGYYGIENLALIPGTVGAAPVQNIGAYGKEGAENINAVHCIDISCGEASEF